MFGGFGSILLTILIVPALSSNNSDYVNKTSCEDTSINDDLGDLEIRMRHERYHFYKVWNSNMVKDTSYNGWQLVKLLNSLMLKESPELSSIAFFHAGWTPFLFKTEVTSSSLCILSKMINASVIWSEKRDHRPLAAVLKELKVYLPTICDTVGFTSLMFSGCSVNLPAIPLMDVNCWDHGCVAMIERAWKLFGKIVPNIVGEYVMKLYNSKSYNDKVMAILMATAITPLNQELYNRRPQNVLLEMFGFIIEEKFPLHCCRARRNRIVELCRKSEKIVKDDVDYLLNSKYENSTYLKKYTVKKIWKKK